MAASFDRRDLLRGGLSLAALGVAAPVHGAQNLNELGKLLGGKLPPQLRAVLPQEVGQAAQIVAEVVKLEQQAKLLRLPASPLSLGDGAIPTDPERLYEIAMPRLVALIDRAGTLSPTLGEQAGALLAKLHRTQYDPPDAWFGDGSASARQQGATPGLLRLPDLPIRPLRLADPPEGDGTLALPRLDLPEPSLPVVEAALPAINPSLKFDDLAQEYAAWFAAAKIRPEHQDSASWHLTMMRESRDRYAAVGKRLDVPWYFIAAVHALEASFNFRAHLHNGDYPLSRRTHQVPAGRPLVWLPPSDWEASATDALRLMGFAGQSDWSLPRLLYRLEAYNGFGYRRSRRASPYLWSFSNLYDRGKFVADGRFDPRARSQQCGAAVMLKVLVEAEAISLG
jgi:lysozyme family protein